jgi:DNA-binding response OmpR family regulator
MAKILLVDDDVQLCETMIDWFKHELHKVDCVHSGTEGKEFLATYSYDVIILDWGLPDTTGVEICKEFRKNGGTTPTLMLTGKGDIADKESGLDSGADDYLTKPFEIRELSARLRALIRRPHEVLKTVLTVGPLVLDPVLHQVTKNGATLKLPPIEFALLEFLMRNENKVYKAKELLNHVWAAEQEAGPETVRTSVSRLRQQIDVPGQPSLIENMHGVGYRIRSIPRD